jgi:hypothetical protein
MSAFGALPQGKNKPAGSVEYAKWKGDVLVTGEARWVVIMPRDRRHGLSQLAEWECSVAAFRLGTEGLFATRPLGSGPAWGWVRR